MALTVVECQYKKRRGFNGGVNFRGLGGGGGNVGGGYGPVNGGGGFGSGRGTIPIHISAMNSNDN